MKTKFISPLVLIVFSMAILTCNKKDTVLSLLSKPPVANAGSDTTIQLVSCDTKGSATLDGSTSSDPDNNISGYLWSQISGPPYATLANPRAPKTNAGNLSIGQYVFQLEVSNAKGLSSKDTVKVIVAAETTGLDLIISGSFNFVDNYEDCYYGCNYYDYTTININFNSPPFGQSSFSAFETADTASTSDAHDTNMSLFSNNNNGNDREVRGKSSINFKKIIQNGGGAFNGSLKIEHGSAERCSQTIYSNSDPLTITGSLDTTAHTISITIKGKTYF